MLLRTAWRNLWRNPRRTWLTVAALTLGTAALVIAHSFGESMYDEMLEVATRGLLGHLQIHGKGYQKNPDLGTVVDDPAAVEALVARTLQGAHTVARVVGFGLAGVGEKSAGVAVYGIEPERERATTRLLTIREGRDLTAAPAREAVLGAGLAKRLKAKVGAELVLVGQGADGSLANDRYTVVGLATSGGGELDDATVFLHLKDAQDLFVLGGAAHLVVVGLPRGSDPKVAAAALRSALPPDRYEALAWNEIMPDVEQAIRADRQGAFSVDFLVFLIVALGIFNTMTMSTFERVHEFGILLSLGTRPRRIVAIVVCEALLLGVVGFAAGLAIGATLVSAYGTFDMSFYGNADFAGVTIPSSVVIALNAKAVWFAVVTVFGTSLLGGFFPALHAARLRPADALRHV